MRIYLLHLPDDDALSDFCDAALPLVDSTRRQKAKRLHLIRPRAASLGVGLLLQQMALDVRSGMTCTGRMENTATALLWELAMSGAPPQELVYRTETHGKPVIAQLPWAFNLSHSGEYVLLAASDTGPVGVDIQEWRGVREAMSERYFSPEERAILTSAADAEAQRLFYRLWCRKEAYGKYTGDGIAEAVSVNLATAGDATARGVAFYEEELGGGYSLAICMDSKDS